MLYLRRQSHISLIKYNKLFVSPGLIVADVSRLFLDQHLNNLFIAIFTYIL